MQFFSNPLGNCRSGIVSGYMEEVATRVHTRLAVLLVVCAGLGAQPLASPDFCALRLRIVQPDGRPLQSFVPIPVRIVASADGKLWRKFVTTTDGKLDVCDVDPKPFDLVIGPDSAQTVVRRLQMIWLKTLEVYAILNVFDEGVTVPFRGCRFFLKVRDPQGHPVAHALLSVEGHQDQQADQYGRAILTVGTGVAKLSLKAGGFRESSEDLNCPDGFSVYIRRSLRLSPNQGISTADVRVIRGTIVEPAGAPVVGAAVRLVYHPESGEARELGDVETDRSGSFWFTTSYSGRYEIVVAPRGMGSVIIRFDVPVNDREKDLAVVRIKSNCYAPGAVCAEKWEAWPR